MAAAAWLSDALFVCGGCVRCFMSFLAATFLLLCQSLRAPACRMRGGFLAVGLGLPVSPPLGLLVVGCACGPLLAFTFGVLGFFSSNLCNPGYNSTAVGACVRVARW